MKKKVNWQEKIEAYTLKNAIEHDGKAVEGSVISALFHEGLKKSEVSKIIGDVKKSVKEINKLGLKVQEKEFAKLKTKVGHRKERVGLPLLPKAKKGKVIMRVAPSPSGPLHIGHAATACISFLYVQKYGGKFYVRIEDTNPGNIYKKAYKMIKEESKWLFDNKAKIIVQSERMSLYYKYLEKLLRLGKAYVCICRQERFKELSISKKNCPCRSLKVGENIGRWKEMLKEYKEGEAVVRFKSGMKQKNPAFRDFPLARINLTKHPLQGKKYRVWPLMNFAVAVDDMEQKMTHIIRAKEHRDNAERQKMIFSAFKKKYPWAAYLGRWHFSDLVLSTSKMRQAIERGQYKGWDDVRLPTIVSLRKQGYKKQAFWKISEQVGLNEKDKVIDKKEYFRLLKQFSR